MLPSRFEKFFIKKLVLLGFCLVGIKGLQAQTFNTTIINIEQSNAEIKFNVPNPNYAVSSFTQSFTHLFDTFKNDSMPPVLLIKDQQIENITLNYNWTQLLQSAKYLRTDNTKWFQITIISMRARHLNYAGSNTDDTLVGLFSPMLDSFLITKKYADTYQIFGIMKDSTWNYNFADSNYTINTFFSFRNQWDFKTIISNTKKQVVYHYHYQYSGESSSKFVYDTLVFKPGLSLPDSFAQLNNKKTAYFKEYTINEGINWDEVRNHNFFDIAQKVTFKNSKSIYVYDERYQRFEDYDELNYYLKTRKNKNSPLSGITIKEYSYMYLGYANRNIKGLSFLITDENGKVIDFRLYPLNYREYDENYYAVVPKNEYFEERIEQLKLFAKDYWNGDDIATSIIDKVYNGFKLTNFNQYGDEYGPYYNRYSQPLDFLDSLLDTPLYAAHFTKENYKNWDKKDSISWIKLSKEQEERHTKLFEQNYIIYALTDTGFVLYDIKYKNKVLKNEFNNNYYNVIFSPHYYTKEERRALKRQWKAKFNKQMLRVNNYNITFSNQKIRCIKAEIREKNYWVFVNDSNPDFRYYPFSFIDSIIYGYKPVKTKTYVHRIHRSHLFSKRYIRTEKYKPIAIKLKKFGWFYTENINGFKGRQVTGIEDFLYSYDLGGKGLYYALGFDKNQVSHLSFGGAFYTARLKALDSSNSSEMQIYLANNTDSFTISNISNHFGYSQFAPFSNMKESVLKNNDKLFNGSIGLMLLPKPNNANGAFQTYLVDTDSLNHVNPQISNAAKHLNEKYNCKLIFCIENNGVKTWNNYNGNNNILRDIDKIPFFEIGIFYNGVLDSIYAYNYRGDLVSAYSVKTQEKRDGVYPILHTKRTKAPGCAETYTYQFINACYNTQNNIDKLTPLCDTTIDLIYGYEKTESNRLGRHQFIDKWISLDKINWCKDIGYSIDTVTKEEQIVSYFYNDFVQIDSAILRRNKYKVFGNYCQDNNLRAAMNINFLGMKSENKFVQYSFDDNRYEITSFLANRDTIYKFIYKREYINADSIFDDITKKIKGETNSVPNSRPIIYYDYIQYANTQE